MSESIIQQIERFKGITVSQLRSEWERLYNDMTRSRNKTFLWRRLAWRIQELPYGGLSPALKLRITALAPTTFERSQVPAGWLPLTGVTSTSSRHSARRDSRLPTQDATLVRRYKGEDIRVTVMDDGFEWDGRRFDSLSEIALAVTGSKWNGWLFFGLTKRKRGR